MEQHQLFRRDFILLVVGQIISLFGNAILRFALPLYLLRQTGSAALFGAVTACAFLPMVIFSFLGGGIADRVNKGKIMAVLDFSTALLTAACGLFLGRMPLVPLMLGVLMALYGIAGAYQPAVQASLPLLATGEKLVQANAVVNMVSTLAGLLGPVIGGVLFGAFGLTPILVVSTLCFLASAGMELFLRIPYTRRQMTGGLLRTAGEDIRQSRDFIRREKPVFLRVILLLALFNMVLSAALIVGLPVMVIQCLGGSDAQLGLTQGAMGLGGLVGGGAAGGLANRWQLRHSSSLLLACSGAVLVMGLALLPGVPAQMGYALLTAMSFCTMGVATVFTVLLLSAVQGQTPPHLLGKIMALAMAVANCAQPVGQALYGLLFDGLAHHAWLVMAGAALASGVIALAARPIFRILEEEVDRNPGGLTVP